MSLFDRLPPLHAASLPLPNLPNSGLPYSYDFKLVDSQTPSDPILVAIERANTLHQSQPQAVPQRAVPPSTPPKQQQVPIGAANDLWTRVHSIPRRPKNALLTWDALEDPRERDPKASCFISEQTVATFDSVISYVDGGVNPQISIPWDVLSRNLANLTLGCSSEMFVWQEATQSFDIGYRGLTAQNIRVQGMDGVLSNSILRQFLDTGTALRRLEQFLTDRTKYTEAQAFHEFRHALKLLVATLKDQLDAVISVASLTFSQMSFRCSQSAEALLELARFCNMGTVAAPPFRLLPTADVEVLNLVYSSASLYFQRKAPRSIRAAFAFLLQETSRGYLLDLQHKLGLAADPSRHVAPNPVQDTDFGEESTVKKSTSPIEHEDDPYPNFVSPVLAAAIPVARRSLLILEVAGVEVEVPSRDSKCVWSWGHKALPTNSPSATNLHHQTSIADFKPRDYPRELSGLSLFDLQPGMLGTTTPSASQQRSSSCSDFLDNFPDTPPIVSPTLRFTAEATLQPITQHTYWLSRQLLVLFLESSNLMAHLCVLRDFLLAAHSSFRDSLVAALFSTSVQSNAATQIALKSMQIRRRTVHAKQRVHDQEFHGVALALGGYNVAHMDWPPGAADISFSLRRVIIEALDQMGHSGVSEEGYSPEHNGKDDVVWMAAESRLGFGLRDIPNDAITEGWFNADGLESLDFLYLTYRPPQPLDDVILSADILSKYQRVFAFLLRLMRVEQVAKLIHYHANFRDNADKTPLFLILPPARALLSRFSFKIQGFIGALSCYTYDIAISRPFDRFLDSVGTLRSHILDPSANAFDTNIDVFALDQIHSDVMDGILSGCLLRSKQHAVSEALSDCMRVILRLGRLLSRVILKEVPEIQAASDLEDLHAEFDKYATRFITTLDILVAKLERGRRDTIVAPDDDRAANNSIFETPSEDSSLAQLLVRMDGTGWWRNHASRA